MGMPGSSGNAKLKSKLRSSPMLGSDGSGGSAGMGMPGSSGNAKLNDGRVQSEATN